MFHGGLEMTLVRIGIDTIPSCGNDNFLHDEVIHKLQKLGIFTLDQVVGDETTYL